MSPCVVVIGGTAWRGTWWITKLVNDRSDPRTRGSFATYEAMQVVVGGVGPGKCVALDLDEVHRTFDSGTGVRSPRTRAVRRRIRVGARLPRSASGTEDRRPGRPRPRPRRRRTAGSDLHRRSDGDTRPPTRGPRCRGDLRRWRRTVDRTGSASPVVVPVAQRGPTRCSSPPAHTRSRKLPCGPGARPRQW